MTTVELLKSIRSLVAYHQSCGINYYQRSASLREGLQQLERVADKTRREDANEAAQVKEELLEESGPTPGADR